MFIIHMGGNFIATETVELKTLPLFSVLMLTDNENDIATGETVFYDEFSLAGFKDFCSFSKTRRIRSMLTQC